MDQELKNLNDKIITLEMVVQENDEYLKQLEKVLKVLDEKQLEVSNIGSQNEQYENLTNLMECTDNSLQFLNGLVEDINEFEKYLQFQINPYNTVCSNVVPILKSDIGKILCNALDINYSMQYTFYCNSF